MGKINICFPIVWNGLIEGRSDLGQYQSFKTVFDKSYADDDQDRRSDVSSFVNARQRRRLSPEIQMDFLKMEKNGDVDTLVKRIKELNIPGIKDVVSAFHYYLSNSLSVDHEDKQKLFEALLHDNPELYIAIALFAGVRYTGSVKMLEKVDLKNLTTLTQDTDFPDAFAEAKTAFEKKEIKEERAIDDSDSQKTAQIAPQIKSQYLQKVLGEMKYYLDKIPDPLPPDVKHILANLSETELHMFLDTVM